MLVGKWKYDTVHAAGIVNVRLIWSMTVHKVLDWIGIGTWSVPQAQHLTPNLHNEWSWMNIVLVTLFPLIWHTFKIIAFHFQTNPVPINFNLSWVKPQTWQPLISGLRDYVHNITLNDHIFIKFNYLLLYVLLYCVVVDFFQENKRR